jgi:hypothetical protein
LLAKQFRLEELSHLESSKDDWLLFLAQVSLLDANFANFSDSLAREAA